MFPWLPEERSIARGNRTALVWYIDAPIVTYFECIGREVNDIFHEQMEYCKNMN